MNPIDPRAQATLDAAINLIRTAIASAAMHVADTLHAQAQGATKIADRDQLALTHQELRRNIGSYQNAFYEALREKVAKELAPRVDAKRKLESADWQTLSLVDEKEVEEQMNFVRLGQMISH
jgi:hypothetical protein